MRFRREIWLLVITAFCANDYKNSTRVIGNNWAFIKPEIVDIFPSWAVLGTANYPLSHFDRFSRLVWVWVYVYAGGVSVSGCDKYRTHPHSHKTYQDLLVCNIR